MGEIYWDLGGFNIFMDSKYKDLYQVEDDFYNLIGSENFSGLSANDWFLVDKETKELSFLLLTVPSLFYPLLDEEVERVGVLFPVFLEDLNAEGIVIPMQEKAFYSCEKDVLFVTNSREGASYLVEISQDFYLVLDKYKKYIGYFLKNASRHIPESSPNMYQTGFMNALREILLFCNDDAYGLMEDKDKETLASLKKLYTHCKELENNEPRVSGILHFLENALYTFYDIDVASC
ncbi:hypothetical protein ONV78_31610 [Hahella sp. CR1]|uniref:hypothetical protein n=1 Tax=Hahella sp. CR1 TaxID=2992807 RepID=UPI0024436BC3|nr:hypothetical protein [Hahella sp. CR1]MDG9672321.1 hypothetical protein [Hahella sp. CR1]